MIGSGPIGVYAVGSSWVEALNPPQISDIDASRVPSERKVIFSGSRRLVAFEGSKRVVSFDGSIRKVKF